MKRKRFTVRKRRRREGKTDYVARLRMLKSGSPRLVVRKANKYITAQIVKSSEGKDSVIVGVSSKVLGKEGWKFSCKNVPAAYLTGLMLGKKAVKEKINKAILDTGLERSTKGSRIYAVLAGVLESGLRIRCSKKVLPAEARVKGKHISGDVEKNFEEIKARLLK